MAAPRVTVLTTLYNKGPFVEDAVRSILANSFTDFELLVVDDASTDDGPERVRAITDPRIRILTSPTNTGRAAAANRGFDAARGELIAVLDADDVAHPERLAKQVAFLDAHPEIGAVGSYAQVIGQRDHVAQWPITDAEARGLLLFEDPLLYGSAMFRRAVIQQGGLRCDEQWKWPGMDYLFLLDVIRACRVATIPEALTSYRIGEHNFRHGRDAVEDTARILREAFLHFAIEANEIDVRAHLFLLRRMGRSPNAEELRALFAWVAKLRAFNKHAQVFTPHVLDARLEAELAHWYYVLADTDASLARLHLRLSGRWPIGRLLYLVKSRARTLLGR